MGSTAIRIKDLVFTYDDAAFRLQIKALTYRGRACSVDWPQWVRENNLAGLISGTLPCRNGSIEVLGHKMETLNDNARRNFRIQHIGFVFQEFELLEYLNGEQNILLPYHINPGLTLDRATRDRMNTLAGQTGIRHLLKRYPTQMSQGERQRVAISRALITHPQLLIADEPTGNLDEENASSIMRLTRYSTATTLLTITHDAHQLAGFDRVINIRLKYHERKFSPYSCISSLSPMENHITGLSADA